MTNTSILNVVCAYTLTKAQQIVKYHYITINMLIIINTVAYYTQERNSLSITTTSGVVNDFTVIQLFSLLKICKRRGREAVWSWCLALTGPELFMCTYTHV